MPVNRRDHIAQWAFDTRSILGRFHLWLDNVEEECQSDSADDGISFVGPPLERAVIMAAAVTALGTRLFGRHGEGKGSDKAGLNRVKKDADAVSAYALSEALWYLTRALPENHAVMVSLGEGIMPKAGETPEMGSNPLLGFGRVYARPEVARYLDDKVQHLINGDISFDDFWERINARGLTVWGAAIDTLENTSRFAKGSDTGPMTILHLFDQPLNVSKPYEGYVGTLVVPDEVIREAGRRSILISYHTPRAKVLEAVQAAWPDVTPDRVHVWTLGGPSRAHRLQALWDEWNALGCHIVEDGWELPGGGKVFTESGTYAPIFKVGRFEDEDGNGHVFLCDGYAASAEAIQAASLDPILGITSCMSLFSSSFKAPHEKERELWRLDPHADSFTADLLELMGEGFDEELAEDYRQSLLEAHEAGIPAGKQVVTIDDFLPLKKWRVLAVDGYMLPDPYTDSPGVEQLSPGVYRVSVRAATRERMRLVHLTLRLMERYEESKLVFSPLLDRFYSGQDYRIRPVKVSDSGRIRNELQTLCSDALEYGEDNRIFVHFDRLDHRVLPVDKQQLITEVLRWYKQNHPLWFRWLEILDEEESAAQED